MTDTEKTRIEVMIQTGTILLSEWVDGLNHSRTTAEADAIMGEIVDISETYTTLRENGMNPTPAKWYTELFYRDTRDGIVIAGICDAINTGCDR